MVEESELSAALRLLMAAARMAATMSPATPTGMWVTMKAGKMRSAEAKGAAGGCCA